MLPVNGLYGHIRNNTVKSALLLAGFCVLLAACWMAMCLVAAALGVAVSPPRKVRTFSSALEFIFTSATRRAVANIHIPAIASLLWFMAAGLFYRQMIRAQTGARPVTRREEPKLYNMVEHLALASGLPTPQVEIMETDALNAYASGLAPSDASVAVTRGLLEALEPRELEAVLAHEMAHIKHRDVRLMVVALIFAGGIGLIGSFATRFFTGGSARAFDIAYILARVGGSRSSSRDDRGGGGAAAAVLVAVLIALATLALSHLGALMTRFAISRTREFMADAGAVELTKDPDALISALAKISGHDEVPGVDENFAAMMISANLSSEGLLGRMFATHPPTADRIAALARHAGGDAAARIAPQRAAAFGRRPSRRSSESPAANPIPVPAGRLERALAATPAAATELGPWAARPSAAQPTAAREREVPARARAVPVAAPPAAPHCANPWQDAPASGSRRAETTRPQVFSTGPPASSQPLKPPRLRTFS